MDTPTLIDYARSLDCIHCGLCLATCPTYRLTGREASSPRGRVHLMRAVAEGELEPDRDFAEEMDFCLLCRHCETVCPSGVQFGAMMEHTRGELAHVQPRGRLARLLTRVGMRGVLPRRGALRAAASSLALAQRTGLTRLAGLFGARGRALASLPAVPPRAERRPLPAVTRAEGERLGSVALLEGCVMPELLGRVNHAAARVLAAAGLEVRTAVGHVCCGSLHAHNGDTEGARQLARDTIERYARLVDERGEPLLLVVDSAGCGSHLKELGALFEAGSPEHAQAAALSARCVDFSELLAREPYRSRLAARLAQGSAPGSTSPGTPSPGTTAPGTTAPRTTAPSTTAPPDTTSDSRGPDIAGPIAYDDPCHLCHGQQIRRQPRELLDLVPGVARVELADPESCCGSAGIYSLTHPAASSALLAVKLADLAESGARTLVTANPGCQLQWAAGVRSSGSEVEVLHLAEVLARGLGPGGR